MAAALLLAGGQALAVEPLRLTFAGAPGCDDAGAFAREVERRTDAVAWTTDERASTAVGLRILTEPGRLESVLTIEQSGRAPVVRTVTAQSCEEVLEASALIVAILLTPRHLEPHAPPAPTTPPVTPPEPVPTPPPERRSRWQYGGGTTGQIIAGVAPRAMPGVEAFLNATRRGEGWRPAFRVALRHSWAADVALSETKATFQLSTVSATLCPLALLPSESWTLRTCAVASYGSLEVASGWSGANRAQRHPWSGVGGSLLLEVSLLPVLALELETSSEIAGFQSRLWFDDLLVHRAGQVASRASLGLAVRLP